MEFENQIAIVTGASEGIGYGISKDLADKGAKVYLVARTPEKLEAAKTRITNAGGRAEIKSADITDFVAMKKIIDEVYETENRLDIFVNNAGVWKEQSIDTSFDEIWDLIEFLGKAPFQISQYLVQKFKDKKENNLKILTVSSQAALEVMDGNLGYVPAKMLLTSGLFSLQSEVEKAGLNHINFYRIYPNTVATEKMMSAIRAGHVQNPVSLEAVVDTAIALLLDETKTRDVRIGYYPGKGIVRTHLPSDPKEFYARTNTEDEVIDANFTPEDLLK